MKNVRTNGLCLLGAGLVTLSLLGSGAVWSQEQPPAKFITVNTESETSAAQGYVTITFDDGLLTQYTNGLRITSEYGITGTLFVATEGVENSSSNGYEFAMNWNQVRAFVAAGWEIGSHTHTHPDLTTLSPDAIEAEFSESKRLLAERLDMVPVSFATPFGRYNDQVIEIALQHSRYHLGSWGGTEGRNPFDAIDPAYISRMDVAVTTTPAMVCGEMLQAALQKTWTVFIFHRIVEGVPQDYEVSVDNFREMMDCAATLEEHGIIDIVTVEQAMDLLPVRSN